MGLVYVGDGATSTGAFHEGLNFAAVQRVPLVVIVEHNGYAYSTPTVKQAAVKRLADKAYAYGIPRDTVDGNDTLAVYEATKAFVDAARDGAGTHLLEVVTYRRKGHAEHDDQRYQPKAEIAEWEKHDPVQRYERRLLEAGWADQPAFAETHVRVTAELDAAVAECENDPLPDPASALGDVYASPRSPIPDSLWFRNADA